MKNRFSKLTKIRMRSKKLHKCKVKLKMPVKKTSPTIRKRNKLRKKRRNQWRRFQ